MNTRSLLLSLAITALIAFTTRAQDYSVKGNVADTISKITLGNTSISVLNAKDSTLLKFTRAAANGDFSLGNLHKGNFILLVTYPDYADYVETFSLDSTRSTHDFGKLNLTLRERLLQEVMIKGQVAAIKVKGDTTEFNAKAFVTQPNAKVEDLLRQLPGIQVDKDGKITAQGQPVKKVLVDGEEFFGDDPTLVTKNLRADMVDKVQLYDKKSDQAAFTGIDDGEKSKTINITLKEDSKRGYFGKVNGGKGGDDFYEGQAMFNSFKAKRKVSLYGTLANTGKTGLSWEDADKYGSSSSNVQLMDGGGIMISGSDDEMGGSSYYGEGIPLSRSGGVHYDNKWNKDKYSLNANYKLNSLEVNGVKNTFQQNTLATDVLTTNSDQNSFGNTFRQKLDLTYQIALDTASNLKVTASGSTKNADTRSGFTSTGTRQNGTMLNSSQRYNTGTSDQQVLNFTALFTHKMKKTGRTYSINVSEAVNNTQSDSYLDSKNAYYDANGDYSNTQYVDQHKVNDLKGSTFGTNVTYTEPFSKAWSMVVNYNFGLINNSADRRSYNPSSPGTYDVLDQLYSNDFDLDQLSHQGGMVFNYKKNKTIFNFGTKATNVHFSQNDLINDQLYKRNFTNWQPQAMYQYRFSSQKNVRISYNGSTNQPSISQLQPVRVNDDPLNITLGNADLDPSFTSRLNGSYYSYKVITDQSFNISGNLNFTNNAIVNRKNTDLTTGVTTFQSVNLDGLTPFNYSTYISTSRKIKGPGISVELSGNVSGSKNYNYTDANLNRVTTARYSLSIGLSRFVENKFDFYLNFGPTIDRGKSSLNPDVNNNGSGSNGYGFFNIHLPGHVQVGANIDYEHKGKTASFPRPFDQSIVTTTLSKAFMKSEALKLTLSGNDIFNQNSGFSRNVSPNYLTETNYNTIRRYFLLSLSWDFSKMGGVSPKTATPAIN